MPMIPLSICIPAYNSASTIKECVQSILSQSFSHFELIIVDDGSTDDTDALVRAFNDLRIQLVSNDHDYIGSLNLSLSLAEGKYIVRMMDADDLMLPHRLAFQYEYMESHPDVDILGACATTFGAYEIDFGCAGVVTLQDLLRGNATSVSYSNRLKGLSGLRYYGIDEPCISLKVWMEGRRCKLLKKVMTGHHTPNQLTECYYAFCYLGRKDGKACKPCIGISEWCNAPMYVPRNQSHWNKSPANGCLGAMVEAIGMDNIRKEVDGTE